MRKKVYVCENLLTIADVALCDHINKVQQETNNCDITPCSSARSHTPTILSTFCFRDIRVNEERISSLLNFAFDLYVFQSLALFVLLFKTFLSSVYPV